MRWIWWICIAILLVGCSGQEDEPATGAGALSVWVHAGQAGERRVIEQQVVRFNRTQTEVQVELTFIPERSYNAQVQAAAVAGELPDLLELDGPYLYNYVWQGHLLPLDELLDANTQAELLPSIVEQGGYHGHLYGVGSFDSGLGLYARRSALQAAGVRIPQGPEQAWSSDEFNALLAALAKQDADGKVLDLKLNYGGEWLTYAFSPLLQSAGGDLIERKDYQSADKVLNGAQSVAAMQTLQGWFSGGYVDPNLDDAAFVGQRVALSWAGHWEYPRYSEALGDDLLVLPLPDLGRGSKTGQGSWVWGITRQCPDPRAAVRFIEFLLRPDEVLVMTAANGAVPATKPAIERSPLYAKQGPLHLFSRQLMDGYSVARPKTPAYPVISAAFQQAFADIRNDGDVQAALNRAVQAIDRDIRDNQGYPMSAGH